MKKKYIIALEDRNVWTCGLPAKTLLLSDVSIFGTDLASVNTGIELTPYTEPDLEQVRKEAFKNGYDAACKDIDIKSKINAAYRKGLEDAWEAARKVVALSTVDRRKVFGSEYMYSILEKHTAAEAIAKIRQYEQEKEKQEKLKKEQSVTAEDVMRQYLDTFCSNCGGCGACILNTSDFTCGRGYHFLTDNRVSDEEVRRAYAKVCKR